MSKVALIFVVTFCVTQLNFSNGIECENSRVGSNDDFSVISAVCNPDGMLNYEWMLHNDNVGYYQIDYNCSFGNDGMNVVDSSPLWRVALSGSNTVPLPSPTSHYSCVIGGCYSREGVAGGTFKIPSATCSMSEVPTTSSLVHTTSIQSSIVPTAAVLSTITLPTTIQSVAPTAHAYLMTTQGLTLIQPTSTPMETLTKTGLADSTLIAIIVTVSVGGLIMAVIVTLTLICIIIFCMRLERSRKKSSYLDTQLFGAPELVKVNKPRPEVEEDAKTIIDPLSYDLILDFEHSPGPKIIPTHEKLVLESDTSSTATSEDDNFKSCDQIIQDLKPQTESDSEDEGCLSNERHTSAPAAQSDASIVLDLLEESEPGSVDGIYGSDLQPTQTYNETSVPPILDQPQPQAVTNPLFENRTRNSDFFVESYDSSRQDQTGGSSSGGYIQMDEDGHFCHHSYDHNTVV